ncbi:cytochrome P450 [Spiractinospora alimapuensis]|uniref:cytochrome P450 n=1 Tax=Spiractinospora alimapuensis TaxID=2820884 RepID=UPI001F1CCFB1|nr:cytochrome P450 [Spiractinospora alimapuensis]QVQ51962.1 cytochrome P450 [Spiractinospora alimapuensis]
MKALDVVEGATRDGIRAGSLALLRWRGGISGDLLSNRVRADPYPMYRRLREMGPVVETSMGLVTTNHAVCDAVLRHPGTRTATAMREDIKGGGQRFQRWLFGSPPRPGLIEPIGPESMIGMDPPDHTRMRRLVSKAFSRKAVEGMRPELTRLADDLVARATRRPTFDLMTEFAGVFPVLVICELLAIPRPDHERFRRWGAALAADLDAIVPARRQRAATQALVDLHTYFTALIERRRRDPGEDLLSHLIEVQDEGERLTRRELIATCTLLLFAGFETTVNLIGNGTLALVRHPEQRAHLRANPGAVPAAVEELLRWDAPIQLTARIPTEEIEVNGYRLAVGQPITLMIGGANRDPEVFDRPETLDLARDDARRHLSFAAGPHHCLGAALARMEAEIAFTTLLERLAGPRLAGRARQRPTFVLRGLRSLPLHSTPLTTRSGG